MVNNIKRVVVVLAASLASQAWAASCESPSDYVRRVFSDDGRNIQYDLDPSVSPKEITVEFFGKRGQVKRTNSIVTLNGLRGTFSIPERVFVAPAQLWFNFVVKDTAGCRKWSLVNEVPIQGKDNLIGIGNPSGEGDAFFLKQKR